MVVKVMCGRTYRFGLQMQLQLDQQLKINATIHHTGQQLVKLKIQIEAFNSFSNLKFKKTQARPLGTLIVAVY